MKTNLFILSFFIVPFIYGQNIIQNYNFENWEIRTYDTKYPDQWTILRLEDNSNDWAGPIEDAIDGNMSVRLNTITSKNEVFPGFLMYGAIDIDDQGLVFAGKLFNKTVKTLHFWYKGEFMDGDNGFVYLILYKDGKIVGELEHDITESSDLWKQEKIALENEVEADHLFIAFLSSKHKDLWGGNPVEGSWLQIDHVFFTNESTSETIFVENYSFEDWKSFTCEEPVGWTTAANSVGEYRNDIKIISKTNDCYSGKYAVLLEGVFAGGDVSTSEMCYKGELSENPEQLLVAYKYYDPDPTSSSDPTVIEVSFKKDENLIAYFKEIITENVSEYKVLNMNFDLMEEADEIEICFSLKSIAGAKFWIDDVKFDETTSILNSFYKQSLIYPNPSDGYFIIDLGQNYKEIEYSISKLDGSIVEQGSAKNINQLKINTKLPKGMYIVKVYNKNIELLHKIIID